MGLRHLFHPCLVAAVMLTAITGARGDEKLTCPKDPGTWRKLLRFGIEVEAQTNPTAPLELLEFVGLPDPEALTPAYTRSAIEEYIRKCASQLTSSGRACLAPFFDIAKTNQDTSEGDPTKLAVDGSDQDYRDRYLKNYLDKIPAPLKNPEIYRILRSKASSEKRQSQVTAMLRKNPGWLVSNYTDHTFGGTIVVFVPGKDHDLFFQLRLDPFDDEEFLFSNSVLVMKSENGKPLARPKLVFEGLDLSDQRDFKDGPINPKKTKLILTSHGQPNHAGRPGSCIQCHMGGLLALHPEEEALPIDKKYAEKINQRIMELGLTEQAGVSREPDPRHGVSLRLGPPLGPIDPAGRTDGFIQKCSTPETSRESRDRIRAAMNCASCHNGKLLQDNHRTVPAAQLANYFKMGAYELRPIFWKPDQFKGEILKRVIREHETMPPGVDLTPTERKSLLKCLVQERNDDFVQRLMPPESCKLEPDPMLAPGSVYDKNRKTLSVETPTQGESGKTSPLGVAPGN